MLLILAFLANGISCGLVRPDLVICAQASTGAVALVMEDPPHPALPDREPCVLVSCSDDGLVCREVIVEC